MTPVGREESFAKKLLFLRKNTKRDWKVWLSDIKPRRRFFPPVNREKAACCVGRSVCEFKEPRREFTAMRHIKDYDTALIQFGWTIFSRLISTPPHFCWQRNINLGCLLFQVKEEIMITTRNIWDNYRRSHYFLHCFLSDVKSSNFRLPDKERLEWVSWKLELCEQKKSFIIFFH